MERIALFGRWAGAALIATMALGAFPLPALPQAACPDPDAFAGEASGALAHVRYLADDALEGRAAASPGERCAAAYIAARLEALGLRPAGDGGSWFQAFPIRTGSAVRAARLAIGAADLGTLRDSWTPFGFSASALVEAPLRLAGRPDPHGGAVVPEASPSAASGSAGAHGGSGWIAVVDAAAAAAGDAAIDPHFLAAALAREGASGLLLLLRDGEALPDPSADTRPSVRIPAAAVAGALRDRVREAAAAGSAAELEVAVEPVMSEARNVVAVLPGTDPGRSAEAVVVGAHYDHLGHGGQGSLAPDSREIHNGADDNASGTAGLIETARLLAAGPPPARPVVFAAFSGEERGLLGSAWFVAHRPTPAAAPAAMINMDMVGRLRDDALAAYGVGTAEEWDAILDDANGSLARPFALTRIQDGYGPSDHASFYGAGVPVLFFFTNTHADYHRPTDDWQAVDGAGIERVAELAALVVRRVAGGPADVAMRLTPVRGAGAPHGGDPAAAESSSGYGPYLGTIPDMTPIEGGVRLTGVREDSPAERAGLREGDVIVGFAGRPIDDLYAYTYALRAQKPGDAVEIVVKRGADTVRLEAILGRR